MNFPLAIQQALSRIILCVQTILSVFRRKMYSRGYFWKNQFNSIVLIWLQSNSPARITSIIYGETSILAAIAGNPSCGEGLGDGQHAPQSLDQTYTEARGFHQGKDQRFGRDCGGVRGADTEPMIYRGLMVNCLIDGRSSSPVESSAENSLDDQVISRGGRAETDSKVNLPLWRNV